MNESFDLTRTMAALREDESRVDAPSRVEAAVMRAWDSQRSEVESGFSRMLKPISALAAGVVLTVALTRLGGELRNATPIAADDAPARMLLVGAPLLEGEPVRVVRMRMAAGTLLNLGIRTTVHDPDTAIDVDVIVGEDGVARAITF
jgi:hypothetical protein